MTEKDIRIHNIALLYELLLALHPEDPPDLYGLSANYDETVRELKNLPV